MADGYIATRGMVKIFIRELRSILGDSRLKFILLDRTEKREKFSTKYCMAKLGFDETDIIDQLKNLKIENYVETCNDKRNIKSNPYYIFDKFIDNQEIYIKVKIESYDNKRVLCMSFHFAEYPITNFPYV